MTKNTPAIGAMVDDSDYPVRFPRRLGEQVRDSAYGSAFEGASGPAPIDLTNEIPDARGSAWAAAADRLGWILSIASLLWLAWAVMAATPAGS